MIDPVNIQVVVLQVWPLCQRCHKASQSHAIAVDLNGYIAEEGRYCENCANEKVAEIKKAQLL